MSEIKEVINILLVDDQEEQHQMVQDSIHDLIEEHQIDIKLTSTKSYEETIEVLLKENFDAAIVDLKLDSAKDIHEKSGNSIVEIIITKFRLPVIVCTGFPNEFDSTIIDSNNGFFSLKKKDDSLDEMILQIIDWYKSGFTKIFGNGGIWEKQLNSIFWNLLSQNINEWSKYKEAHPLTGDTMLITQEKAIMRYTLGILQAYLEISPEEGGYEILHPAEFYIKPSITPKYMFGDILKENNSSEYFVILTPACEMANSKYEKVLLAKVKSYLDVKEFKIEYDKCMPVLKDPTKTAEEKNSKIRKLGQWFRNGNQFSNGYHFIPKYTDLPGGFINFQDLSTVSEDVLNSNYERVASVSIQFAKDISSRFINFYARQGQPSLADDLIAYSFISENLVEVKH